MRKSIQLKYKRGVGGNKPATKNNTFYRKYADNNFLLYSDMSTSAQSNLFKARDDYAARIGSCSGNCSGNCSGRLASGCGHCSGVQLV